MDNYEYVLYATTKDGGGFVKDIGHYDDPTEIVIHTGMFAPDVMISIEQQEKEVDK